MSDLEQALRDGYGDHYTRLGNKYSANVIRRMESSAKAHGLYDLIQTLPPGSKVLDLGCGTGLMLSWLRTQPNISAIGVDSSSSQVKFAREHLGDKAVVEADGSGYLQDTPNQWDAIICFDVLEHVPDQELLEFIIAANLALRPGGWFLVRVPNAAHLIASYTRYMDFTHQRIYSTLSLQQVLEAGGFSGFRCLDWKATTTLGKVRARTESAVHKSIFMICGQGGKQTFTKNICAVVYRPPHL